MSPHNLQEDDVGGQGGTGSGCVIAYSKIVMGSECRLMREKLDGIDQGDDGSDFSQLFPSARYG